MILWDKRWFWVWIAFVDRYSACIYSVSQSYYTALLLNTITLQISKEAQMRIEWSFFFHTWTVSGISWHRFKWANFGIFGDWVGTGYRITVLRWSHVKVFLCLEEKWNLLTADALYTILNVFKTQTKLLWLFCNLSVKWSPCFFGIMQYKLAVSPNSAFIHMTISCHVTRWSNLVYLGIFRYIEIWLISPFLIG